MLILKRKVGEKVRISDNIEVQVLGIEGEVIKLGFSAPREISILRSEVYNAVKDQNLQAKIQTDINAQDIISKLKQRADYKKMEE